MLSVKGAERRRVVSSVFKPAVSHDSSRLDQIQNLLMSELRYGSFPSWDFNLDTLFRSLI